MRKFFAKYAATKSPKTAAEYAIIPIYVASIHLEICRNMRENAAIMHSCRKLHSMWHLFLVGNQWILPKTWLINNNTVSGDVEDYILCISTATKCAINFAYTMPWSDYEGWQFNAENFPKICSN